MNRSAHSANLLALLALIPLMASCTARVEDRFRSYLAALNAHDVDRVVSLHADDFIFRVAGTDTTLSKKDLPDLLGWDMVMGGKYESQNLRVDGDTLHVTVVEQNDFYRAIVEETMEGIQDVGRQYEVAFRDLRVWVERERAEALSGIMRDGHFVFNLESAKKWLPLLEDWRRAQGGP